MKRRWLITVAFVLVACLGLVALLPLAGRLFVAARPPAQSLTPQAPAQPLTEPSTAVDYLTRGDQDFDRHDYTAAIADYTRAIELNPNFAEAYNNRAYTYMTKRDYAAALPDLDRAIDLRPTYVNALMNRGDIYNFYYQIDRPRALADYDRVLALGSGATHGTSICGHTFLARHNGWNLGTLLDLPGLIAGRCN